jgi:hypothetical protein
VYFSSLWTFGSSLVDANVANNHSSLFLTICRPSRKYSPSSLDERWYSDPGGKWEAWASHHLASFGSHVHGKFSLLQVYIFRRLAHLSVQSLQFYCIAVSFSFISLLDLHPFYDLSADSCFMLKYPIIW